MFEGREGPSDAGLPLGPLLATFNKVCKSASLAPIILSGDGIHASLQKALVKAESMAKDVDKWQKEFCGMVSALEKRVDTLEKKVGVKCKADPPQVTSCH